MKNRLREHLTRSDDLTISRVRIIIGLFITILLFVSAINYSAMLVGDGVRAYIRGEGIWAKAQKEAVLALLQYSHSGDAKKFVAFEKAIAVNLGDRQARIALSQSPPDMEKARAGMAQGKNAPQDIEILTQFFLYFEHFPYMAQAIEIWEEGDGKILQLITLANALKSAQESGASNGRISALRLQIRDLNTELDDLEYRFSETLSEGARWIKQMTITIGVSVLLLAIIIGTYISYQILQKISKSIALQKIMEEEIRRQARLDPLTGLGNRSYFTNRCLEHFELARREKKLLALCYLDLDRFKPVNDNHGHATGDKLLQQVSAILKRCSRKTDVVVRLGGDEFGILIVYPEDRAAVEMITQRIIDEVQKPTTIMGQQVQIGISIGIAMFPDHSTNLDNLMHCADAGLYEAKKSGRNQFKFYQMH
uniref:GGDEF domain-containing protein n=1 Tax=Magnetococcus massalia (strain MO-1) TaxID=451514 RepID=A0A1S7LMV9_MAGMO|nr:Conserved protein of unknown function. Containing diguanylate cyclase (GGDEF) domain [Candidatus Magnetococcus massalia]